MRKRPISQRWASGFGCTGLLLLVPILGAQSQESRLQADKADSLIGYELVGEVLNIPATPQSLQFGYLNYVRGLPRIAAKATTVSEATALLTFYNDTATERAITIGQSIRIVDRTGTSTIYFDESGFASFNSPDTFRDGNAVQVCNLRHQVVIDLATGYFTTTFEMVVTSTEPFQIDGNTYRLGKPGDVYRVIVSGHLVQPGPPSAYIAGVAMGLGAEASDLGH